jgi:hypothetical protein
LSSIRRLSTVVRRVIHALDGRRIFMDAASLPFLPRSHCLAGPPFIRRHE